MIRKVKLGTEIVVSVLNKPGALRDIAGTLADRGINVLAVSAQVGGGTALINLVTDDQLHSKDLLRKKKFQFHESPVILLEVEDKPGVLLGITRKLASKKINIVNIYGSAPASFGPALLVVSTDQNQKALVALKK